MPDTRMPPSTAGQSLETSDDLTVEPLGSLEIVQSKNDGKISIRNVMITGHDGKPRKAKEIEPGSDEGKKHVKEHGLAEPQSVVFFKGNCVWFNNRWWC